jgi:hypothetical protein
MCILSSPIFVANIVFRSFFDLLAVIKRFVAQSNNIPKPFVWTAEPRQDHRCGQAGYQTLDLIHSHVRLYK